MLDVTSQDLLCAGMAVFILGVVWMRTRLQYRERGRGRLRLERAGQIYYSAVIVVLVLGWILAPPVGRALWPSLQVAPMVTRVVWFLATYYLCIPAHRLLFARGVRVYRTVDPPGLSL